MNIWVTGVATADVKPSPSGGGSHTEGDGDGDGDQRSHASKWGLFFLILIAVMGVICMVHIITDKGDRKLYFI
jgi:hypothetical protein